MRHPHVFLGLARTILRDRFGDVLQALADLGVEPAPIRNNQGFTLDDANLLELPQVLMAKMFDVQAAAPASPPRPRGPKVKRPSRDDLLAVVA